MEKKITDYLHLYLDAEIFVRDAGGVAYVDTVEGLVVGESVNLKQFGDFYFDDPELATIQLILRPLSNINDDEKKELWHLDDHALHELGDGNGYAVPSVFTWCLLKHFDLFGLISAGLAIDKTTL